MSSLVQIEINMGRFTIIIFKMGKLINLIFVNIVMFKIKRMILNLLCIMAPNHSAKPSAVSSKLRSHRKMAKSLGKEMVSALSISNLLTIYTVENALEIVPDVVGQ